MSAYNLTECALIEDRSELTCFSFAESQQLSRGTESKVKDNMGRPGVFCLLFSSLGIHV